MKLKARLMDEAAMNRALMRISHEIIEKNKGVENVVLVGIRRRGVPIAERICRNIKKIEDIEVPCGSADISFYRDDLTHASDSPVLAKADLGISVNDKNVVLVDDVRREHKALLQVHAVHHLQDNRKTVRVQVVKVVYLSQLQRHGCSIYQGLQPLREG